jgi:hypothetical protein
LRGKAAEMSQEKCPYDGVPFEEVPGYVSGYGCPICKGLSVHVGVEAPGGKARLWDDELRALLNLLMVSDPWPLEESEQVLLKGLADRESEARGFEGWIEAYHVLGSKAPRVDADGAFHCPCGASHSRGPVDGVGSFRCLSCGRTFAMERKGASR